ncbi:hypothetical protein BAE44_0025102, partial [Dichanthelium oligosanthes]
LRSYGVRVDERDLSMHAVFKDELRAALTEGGRLPLLPQVFVDGRHLAAPRRSVVCTRPGSWRRPSRPANRR